SRRRCASGALPLGLDRHDPRGLVPARVLPELLEQRLRLLWAHARGEAAATLAHDGTSDRDALGHRLSLRQDDLGEMLPERSVVIDEGGARGLERKPRKLVESARGGQLSAADVL